LGNLKVIGGEKKGHPLASPQGSQVRPTAARVRKALFDILGEGIAGAVFLDLFAGSGAMGVEALSRGASRCWFIEESRSALASIRKNLQTCGFDGRGRVIAGKLPGVLSRLPEGTRFSVVFADPPYFDPAAESTLLRLARSRLLSHRARIILEHRKSYDPPLLLEDLALVRSVRYGDTALSFFSVGQEKAPGAPASV
jgi:16S rRNA (guanine966-N2)-methyltransferase